MKKTFLTLFLFGAMFAGAQSIAPVAGNSNVVLNNNGEVKIGGVVRGYIQNNQIKNAQQVVIGSFLEDGTIKNANNVVVGHFTEAYVINDANNNQIGFFNTQLEAVNSNNQVIGQWNERITPIWSAIAYFFFNLN